MIDLACDAFRLNLPQISPSLGWPPGPRSPAIASGCIDLWLADIRVHDAAMLMEILDPLERDRAARFYRRRDRSRYVVRRALLRLLLGRYLRRNASDITLVNSPSGKPSITADLTIRFNVSASKDLCLYAITTDCDVGVDMEFIDPAVDIASVAALFAPAEMELLCSLPPSLQFEVFYALWTCKEAVVKCTGQGLSIPLRQIPITFEPTGPRCTSDPCSILRLKAAPDYAVAVATTGSFPQLTCWSLVC